MATQPKNKELRNSSLDPLPPESFQAPVITREPSSRQAKLGAHVLLRVSATGFPQLSYQWFHNGRKIPGATGDRLALSKVRRSSAGAYHCEVKNLAGRAESRQCMLSFFTGILPKLVLEQTDLPVLEGKSILIKLLAPRPNAFRDFRISWLFNGKRIQGSHGPELYIRNGTKEHEGEYKAIISVGAEMETSNACRVSIVADETAAPAPVTESFTPAADFMEWEGSLFSPDEDPEPSVAAEFVKEVTKSLNRPSKQELEQVQPSPLDLIESKASTKPVKEDEASQLIAGWDVDVLTSEVPMLPVDAPVAEAPVIEAPPVLVMPKPPLPVIAPPVLEKPAQKKTPAHLLKKKSFLESALARFRSHAARTDEAA